MTDPVSTESSTIVPPGGNPSGSEPIVPAPTEQGWGKLLLALAAFLIIPTFAPFQGLLPVDQTMLLFVPAVAACALVGWWAGGRAYLAIVWVAIAVLLAARSSPADPFHNLVRGWSLLLAGSFGLVCLLGMRPRLFARSLLALSLTLVLAAAMSLLGPVTISQASKTVADEFGRRNNEAITAMNSFITAHPKEWNDIVQKVPKFAELPAESAKDLGVISDIGIAVFPALLALQSLAALALAWATYHRLSRARLGAPLRPLREFRFNDQLVWGLIVGLTIMLLPTLTALSGVGKNLLVFFGALYAVRGLGVLSWFMAPGSLGLTLGIAFLTLWVPFINVFAALAFMMVGIASVALGLGDTWADWRSRARPTS
jgi:hypothetical protein